MDGKNSLNRMSDAAKATFRNPSRIPKPQALKENTGCEGCADQQHGKTFTVLPRTKTSRPLRRLRPAGS
jgi:hypothetical protein